MKPKRRKRRNYEVKISLSYPPDTDFLLESIRFHVMEALSYGGLGEPYCLDVRSKVHQPTYKPIQEESDVTPQ